MAINRGYTACHKLSGRETTKTVTSVYITKCPSCDNEFQLNGDYSENQQDPVQCPKCKFQASGYNFDFVSSSIEGEGI